MMLERRVSLKKHQNGYRDVYWCFPVNEPTLIEKGYCTCCAWKLKDEHFLTEHKFVCHIRNGNHWKEEK